MLDLIIRNVQYELCHDNILTGYIKVAPEEVDQWLAQSEKNGCLASRLLKGLIQLEAAKWIQPQVEEFILHIIKEC